MSTYKVESSFATQVTVPGSVAYSSVQTRAGFTLTEEVEADSPEEARDIALQRANQIAEDAKIAVAANAEGVTIAVDDNGVTQLTFEVGEAKDLPAQTDQGTSSSDPVDPDDLPAKVGENKYTVLWNGQPVTLFDNRETKKGNQPDFRIPDLEPDDGFWLQLKNGGTNRASAALRAMIEEANEKAA